MLTEDREYHFVAELTLVRSHVLNEYSQPKDDKVNWLFLNTGEQQFSFIYKIEKPLEAQYGEPFKAELAFTMIEAVIKRIRLHHAYEVLRGLEIIGTVRLINALK